MVKIEEEKLEKIKGGEGVSAVWIGIAVASLIIFLSGVIEGLTNPEKCNV
ncbi:MAG: hypothetical protein IJ097_03100 [Bacilli bacterium]|nr:hypothetical protein [Bacilli bacterium]